MAHLALVTKSRLRPLDDGKGDGMLARHPIDVMLMATDLGAAKLFYGDRIGLDVPIESNDFRDVRLRWR